MKKSTAPVDAGSLAHTEARKFWREYFGDEQQVSWTTFSAALAREFALTKSDVESIRGEMDVDGDNAISIVEFNGFTVEHGVAGSLQKLMHAPDPPPRRGASSGKESDPSPWLVDYVKPAVHVSKWQPGRDQQAGAVAYRELKILMFSTGLIAFVAYAWTFEAAMAAMQWVESFRVAFGLMSFLDFCGSTVTCYNYRCEVQRLTMAGDERLRMIYRTAVGFYAQTMLKCNFLQFGGTTVTALILGQPASWLNSHVWAAFIVAYWLVFCSPGDVWFKLLQHGWLLLPIKAAATISAAHALSSWGLDKALTAEHPKIRTSLWGALVCGFSSGCLGGMVAGVAEEGEAWLTSKAPTWPMQRAFYMVIVYYVTTDPHGNLQTVQQRSFGLLGLKADALVFPLLTPLASKVCIAICMVILQFSMDIAGVDLLLPLNKAVARLFTAAFPVRMRLAAFKDKLD